MSAIYDNWESLVAAVLRREQLWQLFHRPSISSETESCLSSSFRLDPGSPFEISTHGDLFQHILQQPEYTVVMSPRCGGSFRIIDDLVEDSGELIGKGTYGISYKAVVGNDSHAVLAKRLKFADNGLSEDDFIRQLRVLAKISHENVGAPMGCTLCVDERVVLYKYYHGGSAASLLHGQHAQRENQRLNWETRLRIGIGAAMGLCHIHSHDFVHGNIKSSNVFLNQQGYGCISDLGLATLMPCPVALSDGYYAPELTETKKFTQESDVYSFGVFLLELLTGRSAMQRIGYYEQHLVNWVTWLLDDDELPYVVFLNVPVSNHENQGEEMEKMLQVSMSCVDENPKHRPKMIDVVKKMDGIWMDFKRHAERRSRNHFSLNQI